MRREANFIEFPGTGMWMTLDKSLMNLGSQINLYRHIQTDTIKEIVHGERDQVFWIDQGTKAATLLRICAGGKSSSVTEVTPRILARYLKE